MKRRSILLAAPAATIAAVVPTLATAAGETPVTVAYREWQEFSAWLDGPETDGMKMSDYDALVVRKIEMEEAILDVPVQNMRDWMLKVLCCTQFGECSLPDADGAPEFWAEARSLIGGAA